MIRYCHNVQCTENYFCLVGYAFLLEALFLSFSMLLIILTPITGPPPPPSSFLFNPSAVNNEFWKVPPFYKSQTLHCMYCSTVCTYIRTTILCICTFPFRWGLYAYECFVYSDAVWLVHVRINLLQSLEKLDDMWCLHVTATYFLIFLVMWANQRNLMSSLYTFYSHCFQKQ